MEIITPLKCKFWYAEKVGDAVTSPASASARPLRADALKNRAKILDAAARVFALRGLEATLDDIADAAGVGVATVYRRFADKQSLVTALFENAIDEITTLALRAATFEDSWAGFVWFMDEVLSRQCENRGLRDVIVGTPDAQDQIASAKRRIGPALSALIERAQRDGRLRRDISDTDIVVLEMMISSLGGQVSASATDLWRRQLGIVLDGLMVSRAAPTALVVGPVDDVIAISLAASRGVSRPSS